MSKLISADAGVRWYHKNGNPCYEIPKKSGDGMKRPTIVDARKMDLYPSVTSILKFIPKPELQAWIKEQVLKACWENPRLIPAGDPTKHQLLETLEEYAKRVLPIADEPRNKAAEHGTAVHDAIHAWFLKDDIAAKYEQYIRTFEKWLVSEAKLFNNCKTEVSIPTTHGYGGRFDLQFFDKDGTTLFCDYKVQSKADDKKFNFYPDWGLQLTAYKRAMIGTSPARLISVAMSATNPDRLETFEWTDQEPKLWDQFQRTFGTFRFFKKWGDE